MQTTCDRDTRTGGKRVRRAFVLLAGVALFLLGGSPLV
jgi:hypothetical protein